MSISHQVQYKLKRCSKKECCKQRRHVKFKDTMTNGSFTNKHKTKHVEHQDATDIQKNFFVCVFQIFLFFFSFFLIIKNWRLKCPIWSCSSELFSTVLDMLNCLVLGTLVPDPNERTDDTRKVHANLVKKLRVGSPMSAGFLGVGVAVEFWGKRITLKKL